MLREVVETLPVGLTDASFWLAEGLAAASEVAVGWGASAAAPAQGSFTIFMKSPRKFKTRQSPPSSMSPRLRLNIRLCAWCPIPARSHVGTRLLERTTVMAIIDFFPPRLTDDATIRTSHGVAETILDNGGAGTIGNGRATAVNACDHCGRRFGMVTYRWWGSKFCKKTCKASFLRELGLGRLEIGRWFGLASSSSSTLASSCG